MDLIEREKMEQLGKAWTTLSRQQRQCLHLRAEGLRYREIAETMQISISSVRNSWSAPSRACRRRSMNSNPTPHPDVETLLRLVDDDLTGNERLVVDAHVGACSRMPGRTGRSAGGARRLFSIPQRDENGAASSTESLGASRSREVPRCGAGKGRVPPSHLCSAPLAGGGRGDRGGIPARSPF